MPCPAPPTCGSTAARRWLAHRLVLATLLCGALLSAAGVQADPVSEGEVKLVLIYKFSRYIEWPAAALASAGRQFTLCTLGPVDGLQAGIAAIEGRPAQGRELHVRKLASPAELPGCQILFVPDSDAHHLGATLGNAHALGILTVGDGEQFTENGGVVALHTQGNRVQFSFNLRAARLANLKISSDLLKLASSVTGGERN